MLPFIRTPNATDYAEHHARINRCRGNACFEEAARVFETRSSNRLQVLIDEYEPERDADGRKIWSGKYRQWLTGTIASDETMLVRTKSPTEDPN